MALPITKTFIISLAFVALLLSACSSAPTLDTSSEEAFKSSLEAMAEPLDDEGKRQLAGSIMLIGMKNAFKGEKELDMFKDMDGWTAEQLIEAGRGMAEEAKQLQKKLQE